MKKNKQNDTIISLRGNETVINPKKEIIPQGQLNAITESMDNIDGNGPPIISDQNVMVAKNFVDNEHKQ